MEGVEIPISLDDSGFGKRLRHIISETEGMNVKLRQTQADARRAGTVLGDIGRTVGTEFARSQPEVANLGLGFAKTWKALGSGLSALKAGTAGMSFLGKAATALISIPIVAVLSAIPLALSSVVAWLRKTDDGASKLTTVTAYLSQGLESLTDIAIDLGKALVEAFTSPRAAIETLLGLWGKAKDIPGKMAARSKIEHRQDALDEEASKLQLQRKQTAKEVAELEARISDSHARSAEKQRAAQSIREKTVSLAKAELAQARESARLERERVKLSGAEGSSAGRNRLRDAEGKVVEAEAKLAEAERRANALDQRLGNERKAQGRETVAKRKEALRALEKQLKAELSARERQSRQQEALEDALSEAAIAKEANRAKREQLQSEKTYKDRLASIARRGEEMRKANYEAAKKAWEASNKDKTKSWADTATAKDVAKNGYAAIELTKEQAAMLKAEREKVEAERLRGEREAEDRLVSQHASYTDKKIAIDKQYKDTVERIEAAMAQASERGDEARVAALKRSLAEAAKERMQQQSALSLDQLKKTPEYVRAFEDLEDASSETLKALIREFEAAKAAAADSLDPTELREYSETLERLYATIERRDPFDSAVKGFEALKRATEELRKAQQDLSTVQSGGKVASGWHYNKATGQIESTYLSEAEARERVRAATERQTTAQSRLRKALDECMKQSESFAATLDSLGATIGGGLGSAISGIGAWFGTMGRLSENLKGYDKDAKGLSAAIQNVSAVVGVAQAMYEMNTRLDSLLPSSESLYAHYARKQAKINEERMAAVNLEIELLKKRQEAERWIGRTELEHLSDMAELNAEYVKAYAQTLAAPQEAYKEARSGLAKWGPAILGAIVGAIITIATWGSGAAAGVAAGTGLATAIGTTVAAGAITGTLAGVIGGIIISGTTAAIGNLVRAGIDGITYKSGETAARSNMRVQTQHKSFWRGEKTQDIESWVKEHYGKDLYDKVKAGAGEVEILNTEVAKALLDSGETLVGETRETLERALEYSEKVKELIEDVRDYISEAFGPLSGNLVDALLTWYEEGTDVLDNFRDYAADTFRSIAKEAMKTMANKLIFEGFQEQLEDLTIAYGTGQLDGANGLSGEENYLLGVAELVGKMEQKIADYTPTLQSAMKTISAGSENVGIDIWAVTDKVGEALTSMAEDFKDSLGDIEDHAEDFAKGLKKTLYEVLVERFVTNVPLTVSIDGKEQVFESLDRYLDNLQGRAERIVKAPTTEEYDSSVSALEAEIEELERNIAEMTERHQSDATLKYFKNQYASLSHNYGYLLDKDPVAMTDAELSKYNQLKSYQKTISEMVTKYTTSIADMKERLRLLKQELEAVNKNGALSDDQRADALKALTAEYEGQLAIMKEMARTYADMAGWTTEQQIDASPLAAIGDDLLSALQDTSKGVEEWKKEIVESMTNDLIKEIVYTDGFKAKMRALQEEYVHLFDTAEDGSRLKTDEEIALGIVKIAEELGTMYGAAEQATEGLKQLVPKIDTSAFDDLRDSVLSALTDIDASAKDFRKSLEKTLVGDLVEKLVIDVPVSVGGVTYGSFDAYSKKWNERYLAEVKALQAARAAGDAEAEAAARAAVDNLLGEAAEVYDTLEANSEEFVQRLRDIAQDTTFTDMEDSLVGTLMDMDGDIGDFANDMKKTIARKLVEGFMVSKEIKPLLDDLQATLDYAMGLEDASAAERAAIIASGYTDAEGVTHKGTDSVAEELEPVKAAIKEVLASIGYEAKGAAESGFSDLGGTLADALTDSEADAATIGRRIGQTMAGQMLDAYIEQTYSEDITALNKKWAEALASGAPDQVAAIREEVLALLGAMGNDGNIEKLTGEIKELEQALDETFTGMGDSWTSVLTDMDAEAGGWGRQIGQTLVEKLVGEIVVQGALKPLLDDIQAAYGEATAKYAGVEDPVARIASIVEDMAPAIEAASEASDAWGEALKPVVERFTKIGETTPLDGLRSSVLSALMDIEGDTEDFAESITKTLTEAFVDKFVLGEEFDRKLADWEKEYRRVMGDPTLGEGQRAAALKELQAAIGSYKEAKAEEAKTARELMGLTGSVGDQGAYMNTAQAITYDQADLIGGMMTSLLMGQGEQTAIQRQILQTIGQMRGLSDGVPTEQQIFNRLGTTNSYLYAIKSEIEAHLGQIASYASRTAANTDKL